jgi:2-iminobutanoate/2-iminopropanoate deaminase
MDLGPGARALPPLSSPCRLGRDRLYIAGQVARDGDGRLVGPGDVVAQATRCFDAVREIVERSGGTLDDVVKVTMYLTDIHDLAAVRPVREAAFRPPYPAWTTMQVSALVAPEWLIEVEAVAELALEDRS